MDAQLQSPPMIAFIFTSNPYTKGKSGLVLRKVVVMFAAVEEVYVSIVRRRIRLKEKIFPVRLLPLLDVLRRFNRKAVPLPMKTALTAPRRAVHSVER
jgi:hypothetical protein